LEARTPVGPGRSDINSLLLLREMDLGVLESIAPLGRRFHRSGIAPPLVMDPGYVNDSLDVFPMEFLEMRLIHETVFGEDILGARDRPGPAPPVRARDQEPADRPAAGIPGALGRPRRWGSLVHFAGYQPLANGILVLLGEPPRRRGEPSPRWRPPWARTPASSEMVAVGGALEAGRAGDARSVRAVSPVTERLGRIIDDLLADR
jgi:hypothetical protein